MKTSELRGLRWKSVGQSLWQRLRGGTLEPRRAGWSVAVGTYIGLQPLYGLHLPLCVAACLPFGLDAVIAYAAANISNPLLASAIVFAEVQLGSLLLDQHWLSLKWSQVTHVNIGHTAAQIVVGAQLLGVVLGAFLGVVAALVVKFALSKRSQRRAPAAQLALASAIARTTARYTGAPRSDRYYVASKLRVDPLTQLLPSLPVQWNSVLDVGCGRGQFGLLLLELGHLTALTGCDWDAHKVECANRAAQGAAKFFVADLTSAALPEAHTALLLDVLHYLPHDAQLQLLQSIFTCLRPQGVLVLRDVDARPTGLSRITRLFEVLGIALQINRGRRTYFQSAAQLQALLTQAGFRVASVQRMPGLSLDNVLYTATKCSG